MRAVVRVTAIACGNVMHFYIADASPHPNKLGDGVGPLVAGVIIKYI